MKVIVLGGSGYIGSHVSDELTDRGHEVIIYDRKKSPYLREEQEMIIGDITDSDRLEKAVKGCDVVYNLAAIADINECVNRPIDTVKYNVLGNVNALEAARKAKVQRFIYGSSVYVYSRYGSFYRSSKRSSELFVDNYRQIHGLAYTVLRYGSLYGGRAQEWNGVHRIVKQALSEGKIIYEGTGEEKREFIHIKDAARLSVDVLSPEYKNQHVILTGNESMQIKYLLEMIKEMLDDKVEISYEKEAKKNHYKITPYSFNPKLGKKLVNNPHVDMGQGILNYIQKVYSNLKESK